MNEQPSFVVLVDGEAIAAVEADAGPVARLGDGSVCADLRALVTERPALTGPLNLGALSRLANFLTVGARFRVIDDLDSFRTRYEQRFGQGRDGEPQPWQDYGPFDLTGLEGPTIVEGELRFCVEDPHMGIPYRACCSLRPPLGEARRDRYGLLPYRSSSWPGEDDR